MRSAGVSLAIEAAGGVNALARLLNIASSSVAEWKQVPPKRVLQIERLTGNRVRRSQMRPDLYPPNPRKRGEASGSTKALDCDRNVTASPPADANGGR